MSQAGKGKPNRVPGTFNGDSMNPDIPPDLVWDEDNPPRIFPCSQHTEHQRGCPATEDPIELDSELQVNLLNEGRAWARAGMSFKGIPEAYQGAIPIPGINVELVDLLMWLEAVKEVVTEVAGITEFEFQEKFREKKLAFLQIIREANEQRIKKQRVANTLGIIENPGLLGPDGRPL